MRRRESKTHQSLMTAFQVLLTWQVFTHHLLCLFHLEVNCISSTLTFMMTEGVTYDMTVVPGQAGDNRSGLVVSLSAITSQSSDKNISVNTTTTESSPEPTAIKTTVADGSDVPRDSPTALVIASSIAAVSILVFFIIAYLWHTHQLDSRARKLAIRLAADAEPGMRCRSARSQISQRYVRAAPKEKPRPTPQPPPEQAQYIALTPEEDRGHSSEGGRSSVGVSESESGDNDDTFEQKQFSPIGDRTQSGTRNGRGAHRKHSRSRKSSSGANLDKRNSTVTDKDILSHFSSRRHSTFFI